MLFPIWTLGNRVAARSDSVQSGDLCARGLLLSTINSQILHTPQLFSLMIPYNYPPHVVFNHSPTPFYCPLFMPSYGQVSSPVAFPPLFGSLVTAPSILHQKTIVKKKGRKGNSKQSSKRESDFDDYKMKDQNSQRNIMSNIARHLMSYLKKSTQIRQILKRVIQVHRLDVTCEDFVEFIEGFKVRNYVRMAEISELWRGHPGDRGLSKAFRVMSHYFLTQKYMGWIQSCDKIKSPARSMHIAKRRVLLRALTTCK